RARRAAAGDVCPLGRSPAGGGGPVPAAASGRTLGPRRLPDAAGGRRGRAALHPGAPGRLVGGARVILDAHQHFWDPALADYPWLTGEAEPLRRRFGPDDLEPLLDEHG